MWNSSTLSHYHTITYKNLRHFSIPFLVFTHAHTATTLRNKKLDAGQNSNYNNINYNYNNTNDDEDDDDDDEDDDDNNNNINNNSNNNNNNTSNDTFLKWCCHGT